jgi:hypothetical protein
MNFDDNMRYAIKTSLQIYTCSLNSYSQLNLKYVNIDEMCKCWSVILTLIPLFCSGASVLPIVINPFLCIMFQS